MANYSGYRWLIDEFVEIASEDVIANRIRQYGHAVRANDGDDLPLSAEEEKSKELLMSLGPDSRALITRLIEQARRSAIHDLACFLEGEISSGRVTLFVGEEKLAESPYASYHYDFVCRLEGDKWPELN